MQVTSTGLPSTAPTRGTAFKGQIQIKDMVDIQVGAGDIRLAGPTRSAEHKIADRGPLAYGGGLSPDCTWSAGRDATASRDADRSQGPHLGALGHPASPRQSVYEAAASIERATGRVEAPRGRGRGDTPPGWDLPRWLPGVPRGMGDAGRPLAGPQTGSRTPLKSFRACRPQAGTEKGQHLASSRENTRAVAATRPRRSRFHPSWAAIGHQQKIGHSRSSGSARWSNGGPSRI